MYKLNLCYGYYSIFKLNDSSLRVVFRPQSYERNFMKTVPSTQPLLVDAIDINTSAGTVSE